MTGADARTAAQPEALTTERDEPATAVPALDDARLTTTGLLPGFGRLWTSSIASNLADGIGRVAVPLLGTTLTRDPLAISVLGALAFLPWLLLGLPAGVLVDRVDRRRAMAVANGVRVLAAAGLALTVATGAVTIWWLYAAVLVWGVGETVYDNAATALVPDFVERHGLDRANGRMQSSEIVVQTFVATPLGAWLFAVAMVVPLWSTAAGFALAALLVLALPATVAVGARAATEPAPSRPGVLADMRDAFVFVWRHRYLRQMTVLTVVVGNALAFGQAASLLLFLDTFGVSEASVGALTAVVGAGALVGAMSGGAVVRRIGRGRTLLVGTLLGGLGILLVGLAPSLWTALVAYALGAAGVSLWNVPWGALRQILVPSHLLGRVSGLLRAINWGLMPVATLLGGWVARVDLQLPFLLGGAIVVAMSVLRTRTILRADAAADTTPTR
ncbi:MFS transporter [Flavimobilis sp. GY10621]|uniref:MFS transporter n=1 Tax=Flavimobilis rhizosphaerae TaxID=2775421 RepID=A0ABR9DLP1_9MICO|nr:MFS transporter [Flavimobilis rhizosphaerae]MBD9698056.1 MFS transporter [Flavimobilis rhizosphaerae]